MIDLPGRLVLQSNIANVTKDIESSLKGIRGTINIFGANALKNADKMQKALYLINLEIKHLKPEIQKVADAFKRIGSALVVATKATTAQQTALRKLSQQHKQTTVDTKKHMTVMQQFGDQAGIAAKRYTAFTIAVGIGFGALRATQAALKESIVFQDKLVKMSQVSGKSLQSLKPLSQEISRLSSNLGVSSDKLADVSLTLLQAGYTSRDVKKALEALAKVELAPSFGDMEKATEAAIAIMQQFGSSTEDLKGQLSEINKVSAEFAVEASDIVTAIQRAGAGFGQLGKTMGQPREAFREFIALFSSVRATTRESAETIATGIRTIATRLQRPATLKFFDDLHIKLTDAKHQFIGIYPAIQKISEAVRDLPATDPRFAMIGEELGGFRQINKTIPLLTQMAQAQEILNTAKAAGNSLDEAAVEAQQSLIVHLKAVQENFLALIREIGETDSFKILANSFLGIANGAVEIARALKSLLPLLAAFAAFRGLKFATEFVPAAVHRVMGKPIGGHASGGRIPGAGGGDTVPAMLTPGEFVINARSAQKLGYHNLSRMNKYAEGGPVYMAGGGDPGERLSSGTYHADVFKQFTAEIKKWPPELQKVAKQFKIVLDESIKTGNAQVVASKKLLKFTSAATPQNISHEMGHIMELSMKEALGLPNIPSHLQGTYVAEQAAGFKEERLVQSQGMSAKNIKYRMKPHELMAASFGQMSDPAKQIFFHKAMHDPKLMARYAGTKLPVIPFNQGVSLAPPDFDPMSVLGGARAIGISHLEGTGSTQGGISTGTSRRFFGNRGSTNNWRSSLLRSGLFGGGGGIGPFPKAGGPIRRGLGFAAERFAGFANSNALPLAAGIGAVGAEHFLGTVAGNKPGERGRGATGEIIAGTLGGAAGGAAAGGPWGAAIGAVVGFGLALHQATEDLKTYNLNDALDEALDVQKKGGTPDLKKVQQAFAEASAPKILDYFKAAGSSGIPGPMNLGAIKTYQGQLRQFKRERAEQYSKEHQGEIQQLLAPEFAEKGKQYTNFSEFVKANPEMMDKLRQMMPHLKGEEVSRIGKKMTGLTGTGEMNLNVAIDAIDEMTSRLSDMADAMKSAHVATAGLTQSMEVFAGGAATFSDRSALIRHPSMATFGETAKELQGLPPEVGMAAYVQANIRRIGLAAYNEQTNLKANPNALDEEFQKIENESKRFGVFSKTGAIQAQTMIRSAMEEGGQKPTNFKEFMKRIQNPLQELLGPAAEIQAERTARKREFVGAMGQANDIRIGAARTRYGAGVTGVEAFNKALEFQHLTGARNTMGAFMGMQTRLAGGIGMNPLAIGARMQQLQGLRTNPQALAGMTPQQVAGLNTEYKNLETALENLTHATDQNTSIEKQLAEIEANKGERLSLAEKFLGGGPTERAQIVQGLNLVNAFRGGAITPDQMGPENFKLFSETAKGIGNIFPGLQKQYEEATLNAAGIQLPGNELMRKQRLQQDILGNFGVAQQAQNVQAGLQEQNAAGIAGRAQQVLETGMGPLFDEFQKRFENAVANMPRNIELNGKHIVQVNINGAEAFAQMKPQFEEFVKVRVQQGLNNLVSQLREKPPNGPGLPIRNVGNS